MKKLIEWLSDYLRYFLLFTAMTLILAMGIFGYKIYQRHEISTDGQNAASGQISQTGRSDGSFLQEQTEEDSGEEAETSGQSKAEENSDAAVQQVKGETAADPSGTETEPVSQQESAAQQNGTQTDAAQQETASQQGTAVQQETASQQESAENRTDKETPAGTMEEKMTEVVITLPQEEEEQAGNDGTTAGTPDQQTDEAAAQTGTAAQTEIQIELQTETDSPDYRTITASCNLRSYPEYGDNVIGSCYEGQIVEFLGEEEGWYKILADGVEGYIGPKFLSEAE